MSYSGSSDGDSELDGEEAVLQGNLMDADLDDDDEVQEKRTQTQRWKTPREPTPVSWPQLAAVTKTIPNRSSAAGS